MKRPAINTTKREIVDYWFSRIDECGLSVDAPKHTKDVGDVDVKNPLNVAILFLILLEVKMNLQILSCFVSDVTLITLIYQTLK